MLITSQIKDAVLSEIINRNITFCIEKESFSEHLNLPNEIVCQILKHFVSKNLISMQEMLGGAALITTMVNAHDLYAQGGFVGQQDILKNNILKLDLEISKLSKELTPDNLDTIDKITSISASIITALSLFK